MKITDSTSETKKIVKPSFSDCHVVLERLPNMDYRNTRNYNYVRPNFPYTAYDRRRNDSFKNERRHWNRPSYKKYQHRPFKFNAYYNNNDNRFFGNQYKNNEPQKFLRHYPNTYNRGRGNNKPFYNIHHNLSYLEPENNFLYENPNNDNFYLDDYEGNIREENDRDSIASIETVCIEQREIEIIQTEEPIEVDTETETKVANAKNTNNLNANVVLINNSENEIVKQSCHPKLKDFNVTDSNSETNPKLNENLKLTISTVTNENKMSSNHSILHSSSDGVVKNKVKGNLDIISAPVIKTFDSINSKGLPKNLECKSKTKLDRVGKIKSNHNNKCDMYLETENLKVDKKVSNLKRVKPKEDLNDDAKINLIKKKKTDKHKVKAISEVIQVSENNKGKHNNLDEVKTSNEVTKLNNTEKKEKNVKSRIISKPNIELINAVKRKSIDESNIKVKKSKPTVSKKSNNLIEPWDYKLRKSVPVKISLNVIDKDKYFPCLKENNSDSIYLHTSDPIAKNPLSTPSFITGSVEPNSTMLTKTDIRISVDSAIDMDSQNDGNITPTLSNSLISERENEIINYSNTNNYNDVPPFNPDVINASAIQNAPTPKSESVRQNKLGNDNGAQTHTPEFKSDDKKVNLFHTFSIKKSRNYPTETIAELGKSGTLDQDIISLNSAMQDKAVKSVTLNMGTPQNDVVPSIENIPRKHFTDKSNISQLLEIKSTAEQLSSESTKTLAQSSNVNPVIEILDDYSNSSLSLNNSNESCKPIKESEPNPTPDVCTVPLQTKDFPHSSSTSPKSTEIQDIPAERERITVIEAAEKLKEIFTLLIIDCLNKNFMLKNITWLSEGKMKEVETIKKFFKFNMMSHLEILQKQLLSYTVIEYNHASFFQHLYLQCSKICTNKKMNFSFIKEFMVELAKKITLKNVIKIPSDSLLCQIVFAQNKSDISDKYLQTICDISFSPSTSPLNLVTPHLQSSLTHTAENAILNNNYLTNDDTHSLQSANFSEGGISTVIGQNTNQNKQTVAVQNTEQASMPLITNILNSNIPKSDLPNESIKDKAQNFSLNTVSKNMEKTPCSTLEFDKSQTISTSNSSVNYNFFTSNRQRPAQSIPDTHQSHVSSQITSAPEYRNYPVNVLSNIPLNTHVNMEDQLAYTKYLASLVRQSSQNNNSMLPPKLIHCNTNIGKPNDYVTLYTPNDQQVYNENQIQQSPMLQYALNSPNPALYNYMQGVYRQNQLVQRVQQAQTSEVPSSYNLALPNQNAPSNAAYSTMTNEIMPTLYGIQNNQICYQSNSGSYLFADPYKKFVNNQQQYFHRPVDLLINQNCNNYYNQTQYPVQQVAYVQKAPENQQSCTLSTSRKPPSYTKQFTSNIIQANLPERAPQPPPYDVRKSSSKITNTTMHSPQTTSATVVNQPSNSLPFAQVNIRAAEYTTSNYDTSKQSTSNIQNKSIVQNSSTMHKTPACSEKELIHIEKKCSKCSGPGKYLCSGCYTEAYCSTQCQSADWEQHILACIKII